ncbi:MAG: protein kinase, partial [Planctomycetes bacterium]|nr:protein kinase [Planctomycetota bacterium]
MVAPPPLLNERYLYLRELGHGSMGRVCLVIDTRRGGERLALKTFRPADPSTLEAFKREFEILSALRHPNLARVLDFGVLRSEDPFPGPRRRLDAPGGLPILCFFTTEYVEGPDLRRGVRPSLRKSPPDWESVYEIAVQLCRALGYLHDRGLLHFDIKPENAIIVRPAGGE